ncbi:MAG: hypothetical protein KAJ43_07770 [Gemmatimonadetes bacterium]|nr:hypothetical protein [Gemmatimonadota bacterium]
MRLGSAGLLLLLALPSGAPAQEQEFESPAPATLQVTSASSAAVEHFWAGMHEWLNIDAAVAAEQFQLAVSMDPEFGIAQATYGFAAPGLSTEERTAEIEAGLASMADATAAEYTFVLAMRALNAGEQKEAVALLETAAEIVPGDPHVAYSLAVFQGANVKAIKKITEKFPEFAPAYNIIAYNAWNEGNRELALEAVQKYVELAGDHPNPYDSYAEILQWDGQLEEAAVQYQKAAEIRPWFNEAYYGLAEVAWLMGDEKEARAQIEKGIEHAPTEAGKVNGRRALANSYVMEGKRKEAMQILEEVAAEAEAGEMKNLAAISYQELAGTDAFLDKGEGVDAYLTKAATIGGEDTPQQQAWTAYSHALAGDVDLASDALEGLEGVEGWETPVNAINAMMLIEDDQVEAALRELEMADETDSFIKALKAECYKKLKRSDEAKELRESVLTDPTINFFDAAGTFARLHAKEM